MAEMPADSVDAIVTDPPYELSSGKPRVGYENCLRWVLLNVSFPDFHEPDAKNLQAFDLAGVLSEASLLSGVRGAVGVGARVNVPVGAVDFENGVQGGEVEITDEGEAPATVSEGELPDVLDTERIELYGDYILQLRGASHLAFCKGTCSCYRQLGAGRVGVPVVIPRASLGDSLNGSAPPSLVSLGADGVRLGNDALSNTNGASSVVASPRTELAAVLALDPRGGAAELLPAGGASEAHFVLHAFEAEGVGTGAGTGGFASPLQAPHSGAVNGGANGANPLGRVLIHRGFSAYLKRIVPQKGFMGKAWDGSGAAFSVDMWREAYRILKPGGHLLSFGGTRRYHRMVSAIEDAGFEIRDSLHWIQGAGFPKSKSMKDIGRPELGTALKPAHEPIVMARKPLSEKNVAQNVLKWGTGAINVDATRVSTGGYEPNARTCERQMGVGVPNDSRTTQNGFAYDKQGRWPPNLLLSHHPDCKPTGEVRRVKGNGSERHNKASIGYGGSSVEFTTHGHADPDGTEPQEVWECVEGCPVREMDRQSGPGFGGRARLGGEAHQAGDGGLYHGLGNHEGNGMRYGDRGGASRFFPRFEADKDVRHVRQSAGTGLEESQGIVQGDSGCHFSNTSQGGASGFSAQEPSAIGPRGIGEAKSSSLEVIPFRYVAKASRRERNAGLEGLPETIADPYGEHRGRRMENKDRFDGKPAKIAANNHPTVKSLGIMRWLVRLVTPPGGTVLDPFAGSGSTGCAAVQEGFNFIGIEQDPEYAEIARRRIAYWSGRSSIVTTEVAEVAEAVDPTFTGRLF